ncbi:MAG: hypothetical protein IJS99_02870 [Synergistaceae bacterium]|nr:hypothetical protein [Synergistaceae bacterium]
MGEINNSPRSYSRVYKLLVHGEDDLAGQIAYSIYKNHKIDKITRFAAQNKRLPNNEELTSFMDNAESDEQFSPRLYSLQGVYYYYLQRAAGPA